MAKFKKSKKLKKKLSSKYKEIAKEREQELKKEQPKVEKPKIEKEIKQKKKKQQENKEKKIIKYKESVASKLFEKRADFYTRSYKKRVAEGKNEAYDDTISPEDIEAAKSTFLAMTERIVDKQNLSTTDAAESLTRTFLFNENYLEENAAANLQKQLKAFGYKVQKRNIVYENGQYIIKGGKYDKCIIVMNRDLNYDESIRFEIQDKNGNILPGKDYGEIANEMLEPSQTGLS